MEPHDLSVVAQMGNNTAERADAGARKLEELENKLREVESRSRSFEEGTLAGR
ncbi:hypothetical protein ACFUT3_33975 [Streptomyces cinereoruber]|uniref:hypothetical protein n=1 Tax=Streptomyces cinereoruber TaxID=67260 RepID=UPI0036363FB2